MADIKKRSFGDYLPDPKYTISVKTNLWNKVSYVMDAKKSWLPYGSFKAGKYGFNINLTDDQATTKDIANYATLNTSRNWGNRLLKLRDNREGYFYKKGNTKALVPFVDKVSTKVPKLANLSWSGNVPFESIKSFGPGTYYLRYNNSIDPKTKNEIGYQYYQNGKWTTFYTGTDTTNIHIALVGGGGGAGGGEYFSLGLSAGFLGGNGGGGAGYVDGLVDMSKRPNQNFELVVGSGGSEGWAWGHDSDPGSDGGSTVLKFQGTVLLKACGGGGGPNADYRSGGWGGSWDYNPTEFSTVINGISGGQGGRGGDASGYTLGVPWGHKAGSGGSGVKASINNGVLNRRGTVERGGSGASTDWSWYTSGGGGGGASACSSGGGGYGAGGRGMYCSGNGLWRVGGNGGNGAAFILKLYDLTEVNKW